MKNITRSVAGACLIAVTSFGFISPASAATQTITVNGTNLAGSTLTTKEFVATAINVPAGTTKVKFLIDGVYLGQDTTAPYTWNVSTTEGAHSLKIRSEGNADLSTVAGFTVKTSTTAPAPVEPTPTPTPTPAPTTGTTVSTVTQLQAALENAAPGATINVADGTYVGDFNATANGTASAPINLVGTRKAIISTGSASQGYGLHITGDYWNVKGLSVNKAAKGIVLDGSEGTTLDSVDVGFVGDEAVHFRKNSFNGKIINSLVHDTGLTQPGYGEGVYVGSANSNWIDSKPDASNNVLIQNNRIYNTTAEGIDIKEGTINGRVLDNVFTNAGYSGANYGDSWVDVKGNGYTISNNSGSGTKLHAFEVHKPLTGWGNNNKFSNNASSNIPGYLVNVQSGVTGTSVKCQTTTAKLGLSNIACTA